jgi:hypothetical protein
MGDLEIPSVRMLLEETASAGTRNAEVYLALAKIYTEDVKRIEEAVRLARKAAVAAGPVTASVPAPAPAPAEPEFSKYVEGTSQNLKYELLSAADNRPQVTTLIPPYYPPDLIDEKLPGEVVVDAQITDEGKVAGVWLVSAMPDIFGGLATASVRQWQFEPVEAKIRIVLQFKP